MVRPHELECCHGIGHQLGVHGCDGCCGLIFGGLVDNERERIIKLLSEAKTNQEFWAGIDFAIELIKGEK